MKYFIVVALECLSSIIFLMPRFRIANLLKSFYLRGVFGASMGRHIVYYSGVRIFSGRKLSVGDDVDFAKGVLVTTDGGVTIGDRVLIGYNTQILSSNHVVPPLPNKIFHAGHAKSPVTIGDDVWIGAGCIILPGASIGKNSIVAAGSVVTKNIPENVYCAGVPAKVIKERS